MSARHIASATAKIRESAMASLLNGAAVTSSAFPCPTTTLVTFASDFKKKYPSAGQTTVAGGLSKHYDLETIIPDSPPLRIELKVTSGKSSPADELSWSPWKDTVQFLQGQLKSKLGKKFLGDCGEPMVRAWFEQRIQPFYPTMTFEGYEKAMSTIGMKGKQEEVAVTFINSLRTDKNLQKLFHARWLVFEADWLTEHQMDHAALEEVVREIIEAKDLWVCVSKGGVQLFCGLKVAGLRYVGVRPKKHGGMSYHYSLSLTRGGETKEVPMECKFHWKNGGQAVQNLNFMLL
jgi:hypothetical protein